MTTTHVPGEPDPSLVLGWLKARSVSRGVPQPVADHGAWRVDTGSAKEVCRYVFATPTPELAALARRIRTPRTFLKVCAPAEVMADYLPSHWRIGEPSYLMTREGYPPTPRVPPGYRLDQTDADGVLAARILAGDGELAASGYAAMLDGVFVYDRIVTETAHRRRGLGRAVMCALGAARPSQARTQVLVASVEGRALYEALGWTVRSDYTTAVVPDGSLTR